MNKSTYIRTSKHATKYANTGKKKLLGEFIDEYIRVAEIILDEIWENGYNWVGKDGKEYRFSAKEKLLKFPSFIDHNRFQFDSTLTARALKTMSTQLAGCIKSATEKQKKRLYILEKMKKDGVLREKRKKLIKKIKENAPRKPNIKNIRAELNSICCEFIETNGEFAGFLRIKSIFKDKREIKIPIKKHRHSIKLAKSGKRMNSFLVGKNNIDVRWEFEKPAKKEFGETVGVDQGIKDVLTLSDKQKTPDSCIHGHTMESIIEKISRKKKGSNACRRAQSHRKNFINWSIKQIDFSDKKEVRFEEIINIGHGTRTSKKLRAWTNTIIRDKVAAICEENGVHFKLQSSAYRSQRCSECGIVCKANRKGKTYTCKHCGLIIDADYNASLNHVANLPDIPETLRKSKVNRGNGFYWLETGFFDFETGRSLQSLPLIKSNQGYSS